MLRIINISFQYICICNRYIHLFLENDMFNFKNLIETDILCKIYIISMKLVIFETLSGTITTTHIIHILMSLCSFYSTVIFSIFWKYCQIVTRCNQRFIDITSCSYYIKGCLEKLRRLASYFMLFEGSYAKYTTCNNLRCTLGIVLTRCSSKNVTDIASQQAACQWKANEQTA